MDDYNVTLFLNKFDNKSTKLENFYNTLADVLKFTSGTWAVALKFISFPVSWFTVQSDQVVDILYYDRDAPDGIAISRVENAKVYANQYNNEQLVHKVNNAILQHFTGNNYNYFKANSEYSVTKRPTITYSRTRGFEIENGILDSCMLMYVRPAPALATRLGYNTDEINADASDTFNSYAKFQEENIDIPLPIIPWQDKKVQFTQDTVRMYDQVSHFYIYCDICAPSYIGDVKKPILKIVQVPREAEYGDQVNLHFDNPEYIQLSKQEFYSIKIRIKKDLYPSQLNERVEEDLKFNFGKIIMGLNIKKVSAGTPKIKQPSAELYAHLFDPPMRALDSPSIYKDRDSELIDANKPKNPNENHPENPDEHHENAQ